MGVSEGAARDEKGGENMELQNALDAIAFKMANGSDGLTSGDARSIERGLSEVVELLTLIGEIAEVGKEFGLDPVAIESAREAVDDIRSALARVRFGW